MPATTLGNAMSDSSALSKSCPQCSGELPAQATEGLCPRCLMTEALQSTGPKSSSVTKASTGPWQPPAAEELQKLLPQYEITMLLGRGGMGAVYRGRQISLDRPVAIKIISNVLDEADASYGERFKNEARAMAKLNHPGIVAVHDYGETSNGILYIVMEYIEGTDVARMIAKQKRLHTEHAMAITAHVCDALAYAHERGIIHRDIKPANIMVSNDGVVKVADFGLAKMTQSGESGLTQSGMAMGTLHYMAPESLMLGSAADHRADIYAVGVMLYQMLTGKVPHGMFELPSMQIPGLDPRYDAIIAQAMREDRDIRYQSVRELRQGLDNILTQPVTRVDPQATQAPAAMPSEMRQQRTAGQPYRPPQSQVVMHLPPKKRSPLPWVAVIVVVIGLAAWLVMGKSKTGPDAAVQEPPVSADAGSSINTTVTSASISGSSTPHHFSATKDQPFINTLGMKFVRVPGTEVLFGIHEVRYKDYAAYALENPGMDGPWKNQTVDGFKITERHEDHPVVKVSWQDAQKFCAWLSKKEGKSYRLPTDEEWSVAIGLGRKEKHANDMMPEMLNGKETTEFPWGGDFPPKTQDKAGNYSDASRKAKAPRGDGQYLEDYDDGFPTTAPVMSFKPNQFGLYDMGGNVWEWCEDWFDNTQKEQVLRGTSFYDGGNHSSLLSSYRVPGNRFNDCGFRCVLVLSPNSAPSSSTAESKPIQPNLAKSDSATSTPQTAKPAVAAPPATPPTLPAELAALDAQFIKLQAERVNGPYEADVAKLRSGYLGGVGKKILEEKADGHLDGILALESEQALINAKQPVPDTDDEKTPASLKALRVIYRDAFAKLIAIRVANLKALTTPLDARLAALETEFTKKDRVADAKTVRAYREALKKGNVEVHFGTSQQLVSAAASPSALTPPQNRPKSSTALAPATTRDLENGYTNRYFRANHGFGGGLTEMVDLREMEGFDQLRTIDDVAKFAAKVPAVVGFTAHPFFEKGDRYAKAVLWFTHRSRISQSWPLHLFDEMEAKKGPEEAATPAALLAAEVRINAKLPEAQKLIDAAGTRGVKVSTANGNYEQQKTLALAVLRLGGFFEHFGEFGKPNCVSCRSVVAGGNPFNCGLGIKKVEHWNCCGAEAGALRCRYWELIKAQDDVGTQVGQ